MFKKNSSGGKDYEIGTLWGNHETREWWQKRATEWHFLGTYKNGPPHADDRGTECSKYCLAIEDDMKDYIELKESHKKLNECYDSLHAEYRELKENNKKLQETYDNLGDTREIIKRREDYIKFLEDHLLSRNDVLEKVRADLDVIKRQRDTLIKELKHSDAKVIYPRRCSDCKQGYHKGEIHSCIIVGSATRDHEIARLDKENEDLKKQLEVMKTKHLMAYNLGLARLKRIEELEFNDNGIASRKVGTLEEINEGLRARILAQEVELNTRLKDINKLEEKIKIWNLPETVRTWNVQVVELQEQVMRYHQTVEEKDKEINKLKQGLLDVKLCWICGRSYNTLKEHDCNLNKEVSNKNKLIGDLRSQLKQLGAKYKNLQKEMALLVERNKALAASFVVNKIRQDSVKEKKCKFGFDFCICPDERTK